MSKKHVVSNEEVANKTNKQTVKADPKTCKHDWRYSFTKHIHECSKCGIPAPPNWNEVGF